MTKSLRIKTFVGDGDWMNDSDEEGEVQGRPLSNAREGYQAKGDCNFAICTSPSSVPTPLIDKIAILSLKSKLLNATSLL